MKKSLVPLVAVAIVAAGLIAFLLTQDTPREASSSGPESAAATPGAEARPSAKLLASEESPQATGTSTLATTGAEDERAVIDALVGRASACDGHVILPGSSPADPTLGVLVLDSPRNASEIYGKSGLLAALAKEPNDSPEGLLARVPVATDGSFRIALPSDRDEVWLALDGRYLYSSDCTRIDAAGGQSSVAIEPREGALVRGRVSGPGAAAADLAGAEVELSPSEREAWAMEQRRGTLFERSARVDAEAGFEFRAVNVERSLALSLEAEGFAPYEEDGIDAAPLEAKDLDVRLLVGGSVRGFVKDETGAPIAEAEVAAARNVWFGFVTGTVAEAKSDGEGAFALEHITPGKVMIVARHPGRLEANTAGMDVRDGETLSDVTLVLSQGAAIHGRVRYPDGEPAAAAQVRVEFDPAEMMGPRALNARRGARGEADADADGRFAVLGLGPGPFVVSAIANLPGASEDADAAKPAPEAWLAKVSGITPSETELELVLAPSPVLEGSVVDSEGLPVGEFHVAAHEKSPMLWGGSQSVERDVVDPDGRFRIDGLTLGIYEIEASAKGYAGSVPVEVTLPRASDAAPLVLEMPPVVAIRGSVLDPAGKPVGGAQVVVSAGGIENINDLVRGTDAPSAKSDEKGRFELLGLGPGAHALVASHPDHAASAAQQVSTTAERAPDDVVLTLRVGATLTGEIFGKDGEHAVDCSVMVTEITTFANTNCRTDADGLFRTEHLAPGNYRVVAMLGDFQANASDAADEGGMDFLDQMRFTMLELADLEEKHIVLGEPLKDPTVVRGKVTHAGEPVHDAFIVFVPEKGGGMERLMPHALDERGEYEIELAEPGRYLVQVQSMGSGGMNQNTVEFAETIPDSEESRLDLVLPGGRISGVVLGEDREPLSGARVTLTTEGGIAYGTMLGGHYGEASTRADGSYEFPWVRPGTYSVAAGGALFGGAFGGGSGPGRVVKSGIAVAEGESVDGVDFRLVAPGSITGSVLDAKGDPVSGATIFVRDDAGRLMERFSFLSSDSAGSFEAKGLAPGVYTLTARNKNGASQESAPVRVSSEEPSSATLHLASGTIVRVTVIDESDSEVRASISVTDPNGHEMSGMIGFAELMELLSEGGSSTEFKVGPLPPGRYTVRATTPDGRSTTKPFDLDGQGERKIRLKLKN